MAIFKSIPSIRIINGHEVKTSDSIILTNTEYSTNGEHTIIVKGVDSCELFLNPLTTDHVVIKALTNVIVKSNTMIDEEYNEIEMNNGACVEFKKVGEYWYILSSDGLKND